MGPATAALCEQILEGRPHPEQGYRACLGIVRLVGSYGAARVEAAAERAIEIGARTYRSVKSILDNKLDRRAAPKRPAESAPIRHPNIRVNGAAIFLKSGAAKFPSLAGLGDQPCG